MHRLALFAVLLSIGCGGHPGTPGKDKINVAAAANLTRAFAEVGQAFERETGIHVIYSLGATTQLTQQIEHGAPYDVFAAADVEHIDELARKNLILPDTRAVYARGKLVLWVPDERTPINRLEDLTRAGAKHIAIANPQFAPYGQAAVESLRVLGLWNAVEPRIVYAPNVSTATQYASTGNVDAAFTALALVYDRGGRKIEVPENLHKPIDQAIAVIRSSARPDQARQFVKFVTGTEGRAILRQYGYQ